MHIYAIYAAEMKGSNTTRTNYTIPTTQNTVHYKHCTSKRRFPDIVMQHKHQSGFNGFNSLLGLVFI